MTFLSPGIINHIFYSELLKTQLLRQRSSQKVTEEKMKSSEICLFSWMRRRKISSEMGFLRSPKQLHQMLELSFDVPTIFLDTDSWENVIFRKLYAFEHCESNVIFFSKMVFGLLHQMLSWKMQNDLCGLTTCSENIILYRAIKAYLFPKLFHFWASHVQSSPKK